MILVQFNSIPGGNGPRLGHRSRGQVQPEAGGRVRGLREAAARMAHAHEL